MRRLAAILLVLVPCVALAAALPRILGHALFGLGFRHAAAPLLGDPGWRGYMLARDGDYLAAANAFGTAPANAYNRGNALVAAGRYEAALDAYDAALDADPEDEDARFNRALLQKILDSAATPPGETSGHANASARSERRHGGVGNQSGDTNSVGIGFVGNKEGSTDSGAQGGSKVSKIGRGKTADSGDDSQKATGSAGQSGGRGRSGGDLVDITTQLALNQRRYSPIFQGKQVRADVQWLRTVQDDPGSFLKLQIQAEHRRRLAQEARDQGESD